MSSAANNQRHWRYKGYKRLSARSEKFDFLKEMITHAIDDISVLGRPRFDDVYPYDQKEIEKLFLISYPLIISSGYRGILSPPPSPL
jgi:hypothetical protein